MGFSEKIKNLRQERLLSQEAFAKELGVSFATVNRWETGKTQPTYKALRTIKEYCEKNRLFLCLIVILKHMIIFVDEVCSQKKLL